MTRCLVVTLVVLAGASACASSKSAEPAPHPPATWIQPLEPDPPAPGEPARERVAPFLLAVGRHHSCAQRNGSVRCWGLNRSGQLGVDMASSACDQERESCSEPLPVRGLGDVDALALGHDFSCALEVGGRVRCWGGLVGSDTPQELPAMSGAIRIAAGDSTLCALRRDRSIACVGTSTPPPASLRAEDLCVGSDHACAVTADRELYCWGSDAARTRGLASDDSIVTGVVQATCGDHHTCARHDDGTIDCWGWGPALDEDADVATPTRQDLAPARHISAGRSGTCAVSNDGKAHCWGSWGFISRSPNLTDVGLVGSGEFHICASSSAALHCWGTNTYGVVGDGSQTDRASPVRVRW